MPTTAPLNRLATLTVAGLLASTLLVPPAGADDVEDAPLPDLGEREDLTPSLTDTLLSSLADRDPDRVDGLLSGLGEGLAGDGSLLDAHGELETASLDELRSELRTERAELLSGNGPEDFGEAFSQFRSSGTLDGALAGTAADSAGSDLLSSPTLELPDLDTAGIDASGERAAFGTFYVNTISSLIDDHPDLVDDLDGSALSSADGRSELRDAMQEGSERTLGDFNDMMPAPEVAGMLHALGSGDGAAARELSGGDGDDGCVTAGLYLREEMFDRLASPSASPDIGEDAEPSRSLGGGNGSGDGAGNAPDLPGWVGDAAAGGSTPEEDDGDATTSMLPSPGADASLEDCGDAASLRDSVLDSAVPSVTGRLEGLLER